MSIWTTAQSMADKTPADRNRYVDFLRALSIFFVIIGHWLIATAVFDESTGALVPVDVLSAIPATQWLTWLFQVMPIFFIVGGYSNAISIESAKAKNQRYGEWLSGRLHRLLTPLLLLVVVWALLSVIMYIVGAQPETITFASKAALVPTWFLAIYTMIVLLAPASYAFWRRYGWASLAVFIGLAIVMDVLFFQFDIKWPSWSNYFWVWLAVHHLGFAWFDGKLGKPVVMLAIAIAAIGILGYIIFNGPYPLAMAGSPDKAVSNSLPPKVSLIILGIAQFGLLHAIQKPMQKLLAGRTAWSLTVLVNSMIMTVYLWHMTILILAFGASYLSDGFGMNLVAGSEGWWLSRPLWIGVLAAFLIPLALGLSFLERLPKPDGPTLSTFRLVFGACLSGLGIALASLKGFNGDPTSIFAWSAIILLIAGCLTCGIRLLPKSQNSSIQAAES
ncbi:acyltransferase family protein [Candidatus Pelagadaptatus aseana]|uniref:acyltransferase family protein n=1 Tax=Candidatus Pelagadaptatus aseana TaxID=3120508 RepID=UPI003C700CF9